MDGLRFRYPYHHKTGRNNDASHVSTAKTDPLIVSGGSVCSPFGARGNCQRTQRIASPLAGSPQVQPGRLALAAVHTNVKPIAPSGAPSSAGRRSVVGPGKTASGSFFLSSLPSATVSRAIRMSTLDAASMVPCILCGECCGWSTGRVSYGSKAARYNLWNLEVYIPGTVRCGYTCILFMNIVGVRGEHGITPEMLKCIVLPLNHAAQHRWGQGGQQLRQQQR